MYNMSVNGTCFLQKGNDMERRIAVIGASRMDVTALTEKALSQREVNNVEMRFSFGGSGLNIARDLALLGQRPALISLFGRDQMGMLLASACQESDIDISRSDASVSPSAAAISVHNERSENVLVCTDNRIIEEMTPAFFASRLKFINGCEACLFGADLPKESIEYLAENVSSPLFALGVSPSRVSALTPALPRLFGICLNLLEARRLTGRISPGDCAAFLCEKGIKLVIITLGAEGCYVASTGTHVSCPSMAARPMVSKLGAGDAVAAVLLWAFSNRLRLRDIAVSAMRAAAVTCASEDAVSPDLSEIVLLEEIRKHMQEA